jgi:mono/diheme cytochrome c family protein
LVATLFALAPRAAGADAKRAPGLVVTFTSGERRDSTLASEVALYVEAGKPPTPFLPGGKFTATWEGAIHADLRGNYQFQAEVSGALKVEINGAVVLDATSTGDATPLTKPIQLNKGANAFKAAFTAPASGDAFTRLGWTEKGVYTTPIPAAAFTRSPSPELLKPAQLRLGRELFLESRCIRCHTDTKLAGAGLPELNMDAPSLEAIGARRRFEWMAQWLLDPKALRPSARMPKLLSGPGAKEDAIAIAAYLASLQTGGEPKFSTTAFQTKQNAAAPADASDAPAGSKPLYERLHCIGCHNPPDAAQPDPAKLSQKRIAEKFPPGKLAEYLRAPSAHYEWTRMPDFHLSADEAKQLEEFLFAAAPKAESKPAPTDAALLERGKKLVQSTGCLNCHTLKLENKFAPQTLESLHSRHLKERSKLPERDCLGLKPLADYGFTTDEKAALDAFTLAGFDSLARHVPAEFAERQTRLLNCNACHGQLEGFPPLEQLGAKLKPEWMARFLAGDIGHKIRFDQHARGDTWLEARMPAFKSRAALLAPALAAAHGFPPRSPAEPPVDTQFAEVGRKLVGKVGGYSCVLCHAVGARLSVEVFESEGINLAYSADRLQPSFFRRWLRAPTSVDPQTKMPAYFEEAQNQLTEVLDGDSEKQMSAIWEYLRLRDKMPAPLTGDE